MGVKKLLNGIVEFRRLYQSDYREAFGKLATGQSPDSLFVACSDSRVVPNTFASTNPGDVFVVRNVGNLIPPCGHDGESAGEDAEAAAIEFAVESLKIADIIVCGHSECGAMRAILDGRDRLKQPNLRNWLRHGEAALSRMRDGLTIDPTLSPENQLSQINVLLQMEHVKSYPSVQSRVERHKIAIHGWWFDLAKADVYAFDLKRRKFVLIDESEVGQLIQQLEEAHRR